MGTLQLLDEADQVRQGRCIPQSPDYGVFQDVRVVLSPNTRGKEADSYPTLVDRETFVVSNNVPMRDGETNSQEANRVNSNTDHTRRRGGEPARCRRCQGSQRRQQCTPAGRAPQPAPEAPTSERLRDADRPTRQPIHTRDPHRDFEEASYKIFDGLFVFEDLAHAFAI